ncbi:MAG: aldose 1-epimerase family protein [Pseudonocardia sp.]
MTAAAVGREITVRARDQELTVTDLGAGMRAYSAGRRAVLDGCAPGQPCTAGRGNLLLPWPNRIAGATYRFEGVEHHLAVTEESSGSAIHGLTRRQPWRVLEQRPDGVVFGFALAPQQGYPFALDLTAGYALTAGGLEVRVTATNVGRRHAPYAAGAHPYLTVGTDLIDQAVVEVPADLYYPTDDRGVPTGRRPVDGTPYDLRAPQVLGERRIDNAYGGLRRDPDGRARVRLTAPDGRTVALWCDGAHGHLQLFTGDHVPEPGRRRRGLAVEPMTAAPDAFNTGDGLVVLAPGATHVARWGIEPG